MSHHSPSPLVIWTLIATRNRPDSLARALRSVLAQRRRPDHLVIVDDSDKAGHRKNEAVVNQMEFESLRPHFMPNYRTRKRAAGACAATAPTDAHIDPRSMDASLLQRNDSRFKAPSAMNGARTFRYFSSGS